MCVVVVRSDTTVIPKSRQEVTQDHKVLQLGLNALQDLSMVIKWLLKLNILKCKTVFFVRNIKEVLTYSIQRGYTVGKT